MSGRACCKRAREMRRPLGGGDPKAALATPAAVGEPGSRRLTKAAPRPPKAALVRVRVRGRVRVRVRAKVRVSMRVRVRVRVRVRARVGIRVRVAQP